LVGSGYFPSLAGQLNSPLGVVGVEAVVEVVVVEGVVEVVVDVVVEVFVVEVLVESVHASP
jgi:hypothetical protein